MNRVLIWHADISELKLDTQVRKMCKNVSFSAFFDNFQHLASIEHKWIPKKILIYVIALDKIYIIYQ